MNMDKNLIAKALLDDSSWARPTLDQVLNDHFSSVHLLDNIHPQYMVHFILGLASMLLSPEIRDEFNVEHVFFITYPEHEAAKIIILSKTLNQKKEKSVEGAAENVLETFERKLHVRSFFFGELTHKSPRILSKADFEHMAVILKEHLSLIVKDVVKKELRSENWRNIEDRMATFMSLAEKPGTPENEKLNDIKKNVEFNLNDCTKSSKEYVITDAKIYRSDSANDLYRRKKLVFLEVSRTEASSGRKTGKKVSKSDPAHAFDTHRWPSQVEFPEPDYPNAEKNSIIIMGHGQIYSGHKSSIVDFSLPQNTIRSIYKSVVTAHSNLDPSSVDLNGWVCTGLQSHFHSLVSTSLSPTDQPYGSNGRTAFLHAVLLMLSYEFDFEISLRQPAFVPVFYKHEYAEGFRRQFFLVVNFHFKELFKQAMVSPVIFVQNEDLPGLDMNEIIQNKDSVKGSTIFLTSGVNQITRGLKTSVTVYQKGDKDFFNRMWELLVENFQFMTKDFENFINSLKSSRFEHSLSDLNYNSRCFLGKLIMSSSNNRDYQAFAFNDESNFKVKFFLKSLSGKQLRYTRHRHLMFVFHEYPQAEIITEKYLFDAENLLTGQQNTYGDTLVINIYQTYVHAKNDFFDERYKSDFINYKFKVEYTFQHKVEAMHTWKLIKPVSKDSIVAHLARDIVRPVEETLQQTLETWHEYFRRDERQFEALADGLFLGQGISKNIVPVDGAHTTVQYFILSKDHNKWEFNIGSNMFLHTKTMLSLAKDSTSQENRSIMKVLGLNFIFLKGKLEMELSKYANLGVLSILKKTPKSSSEASNVFGIGVHEDENGELRLEMKSKTHCME